MFRKKCVKQRGFSIPELGMVMLITGVTMITTTQFVHLYTENAKYSTTIENLEMIRDALEEYSALNGAYPCPANPAAKPGDADYGVSKCRDTANASFDENNCALQAGGVECTTVGSRDADKNGFPDVVIIGAIPHVTLAAGVKATPFRGYHKTDGYGALFTYAVTENLTETYSSNNLTTPYNPLHGSIDVRDENMNSIMDPDGEAQFVIFSHGMDNVGGYTGRGELIEDCFVPSITLPPPATQSPVPGAYSGNGKIQTENCDDNDAIFVKGLLSFGDNNNYFDDFLYFKGRGIEALWKRSLVSPSGESYIYNTNLGNVGVGTSQPDSSLHVKGDIRSELHLIAPKYCEPGKYPDCDMDVDPLCGGECLDPEFLAADIGADARCAAGQVAYAVGENKIVCKDVAWTVPAKTCQDIRDPNDGIFKDAFIQGFSNKGNLYCCLPDNSACEKQCDTDPCPCQTECSCDAVSCQCTEVCP